MTPFTIQALLASKLLFYIFIGSYFSLVISDFIVGEEPMREGGCIPPLSRTVPLALISVYPYKVYSESVEVTQFLNIREDGVGVLSAFSLIAILIMVMLLFDNYRKNGWVVRLPIYFLLIGIYLVLFYFSFHSVREMFTFLSLI